MKHPMDTVVWYEIQQIDLVKLLIHEGDFTPMSKSRD
jgi:hypothetical protein